MKLTSKQRKFIELYNGNATEAAILAGYSKNTAYSIGCENLTKPEIISEIKKRTEKELKPNIMSRQELQAFWCNVIKDTAEQMTARLKASELFGRSNAEFVDKVENKHSFDYASLTEEQRRTLVKKAVEVINEEN